MNSCAFAFSLLLPYNESFARNKGQFKKAEGLLAIANELVAFEGSRDLISGRLFFDGLPNQLRPEDLANAAQVYRLRSLVIQRDDVFNRSAQVRISLSHKKHPARTDVLSEPSHRDTFGARSCDGQGELQGKPPGS